MCTHTQTCTWHTCHTRHACQCDTWREMCTWSHRITNNAPIQSSLLAHMMKLTFVVHILHITMPWNNSRRLKMNKVSRWRLSDQLMLHARKCYIVQSHAWVLHVHLHTSVSTVFLVRIFIMQCEERCKCTYNVHAYYTCLPAFHQMFWLCCTWYLDAQSILSMRSVLLQLVVWSWWCVQ